VDCKCKHTNDILQLDVIRVIHLFFKSTAIRFTAASRHTMMSITMNYCVLFSICIIYIIM